MQYLSGVSCRKIIICFLCCMISITSLSYMPVKAETEQNSSYNYALYRFDDNKYEFEKGNIAKEQSSLGSFSILGDYSELSESDIPKLSINSGNLKIQYKWIADTEEPESTWYIGNEKTKSIDIYNIHENIGKGVILVQSSKDKVNWSTNEVICNFVENLSSQKEYIYETNEVQVNSGCYFRIIVAYKMEKYINKKVLFFNKKQYEHERFAEVYTFYAINSSTSDKDPISETKYVLSDASKYCRQFTGYADTTEINVDDIHYGWNLGNFLVSGHTDVVLDNTNTPVVLKNVGDQVVLWFRLDQNIDSLNNDDNLKITSDSSGKDQHFGTNTQDFGRGALFISKKDNQREQAEIETYVNYLEADVVPGVDTMISLFEEGDYEVTLDYQVTKTTLKLFGFKILDKTRHYKINFEFKVRNSNCMIYPLDVDTNEKLINGSYTKNGFYLDLAKSKYLQINVKKSDLKDGTLELVEDVHFNQLAKESDKFTEEGLYTITVTNRYTNISDEKRIYVGENNILKAYAVTGKSISEIQKLLENGAIINEDGTIGVESYDENTRVYAGLDDDDLATFLEDSIYLDLIKELKNDNYLVEKVQTKYISKDYIENLAYNSMNNLYFGYDTKELDSLFGGQKYVFTLGDNFQTIAKPVQIIDDSISGDVLKNVVVGSGVILICVTVSAVAAPTAPAISLIFAASATTGTTFALQSGALSGIAAGIIRAYQTGDLKEAVKTAAVAASEGFKWGAISGVLTGGAKAGYGIYQGTANGLSMNDVVRIQQESGYPMELIKQFKSMEEYKVYKGAGLYTEMVNGKMMLIRNIDLNYVSELPDGSSVTNLQRMLKGYAPLDPLTGKAYQLHHINQAANGTLAVLTEAEHQGNATILNTIDKVSEINRTEFAKQRAQIWMELGKVLSGGM